MRRHWIALLCVLLAGSASASDAEQPWWGHEPEAEIDHQWWGDDDSSIVVLGGFDGVVPEAPTPLAAADVALAASAAPSESTNPAAGPDEGAGDELLDDSDSLPGGMDLEGTGEAPDDLAPLPAQKLDDREEGNRCRRYAKQIVRFEGDLEIAEERENDVWKQVTEDHLERLRARKEVHCPEPEGPSLLLETVRMLAVAAKVAAKLYTWGAF